MATLRESLAAAGYLAGWKIVSRLPEAWSAAVFRWGADKASDNGVGMEQLRRNLARVVGPENVTRALVRDAMRSYARYWLEAFRLPRLQEDPELLQRLRDSVQGREYLDANRAEGRGLILALPHTGNWDMAGVFLVDYCGQFTTVAERLKPEVLFDAFVDYRESLGFEVVALTGDKQPPYQRLREVLERGGIVCLLAERDLTRSGVPVEFFGETANFAAGPAKLAQDTGAALHAVHCWFTDPEHDASATRKGWGMSVSPEIPVTDTPETTQRLADIFADNIAAHPADWHMLQPQWNADIAERDRRRAAARAAAEGER
ncbi:phosphatidylinositol mannoside acyltransferase [Corynebacterium incognita]|uniref:Phosphatidylinositol mannoside acyltransferase n=1 Tax=Corynebacterium incognita TaxID=2754725 RepID=A0A7G7CQ03_9CORY|nr:phosphatidylinositol mannoside acyltransferase [Corynebacterium incognita]QNE89669.1 phosphatidylinositol mannoside acyltransferase [Corynebacterium incognita]